MSKYLIDSDVIIWTLRGRINTINALYSLSEDEPLACSVINVLEVELGSQATEMSAVRDHFDGYNVLPVTVDIARKAAELIRSSGHRLYRGEWADATIAATALVHNFTIVTYNTRHFRYSGLSMHHI